MILVVFVWFILFLAIDDKTASIQLSCFLGLGIHQVKSTAIDTTNLFLFTLLMNCIFRCICKRRLRSSEIFRLIILTLLRRRFAAVVDLSKFLFLVFFADIPTIVPFIPLVLIDYHSITLGIHIHSSGLLSLHLACQTISRNAFINTSASCCIRIGTRTNFNHIAATAWLL